MAIVKYRGFRFDEPTLEWFKLVEEVSRRKGWVKNTLDIYQVIGGSSKSGGTHLGGGAIDHWISSNVVELVRLERNAGACSWHRRPSQGFAHHIHAGGKGLGKKPYNYQITALERGRNGLASNGKDDGPRNGVVWPLRTLDQGVDWLKSLLRKTDTVSAKTPSLPDFWNPWLAVDAWDNDNGPEATLTGIGDDELSQRFIVHGFDFYRRSTLHENMRFTLADFAGSLAMSNIDRPAGQVAWDLLNRVKDAPNPAVTWCELRPAFDAGHAQGKSWGPWGEQRTRHSVRAIQEGLIHAGEKPGPVDGIYGPSTRTAVSSFQVNARGARPNTHASDGVVGVHDFLHLMNLCSQRLGREHRGRHLY